MSPFLNAMAIQRPTIGRVAPILFWEYAARGWRSILFGPAIALLLPAFVLAMGWLSHNLDAARAVLSHASLYWMVLLVLVTVNLVEQGKTRPRYSLPVSSWLLVGIPMLAAMLTIFVHYALTVLVVNQVLHSYWQFWGPGLHAVLLMAWCQMIFFAAADWRSLKWIACLASFVGLIVFTYSATENSYRMIPELIDNPSGWYLMLISCAIPAFVILAVVAFDLMRHGTGIELKQLVERIAQFRLGGRSTWAAPFRSAATAQSWLEWRERGYAYPLIAIIISVAAAFLALWLDPGKTIKDGNRLVAELALLFYLPVPIIGFFWGSRSSTFEFGEFSASRPLADRQIGTAVLKSATLGLLSAGVIACLSFCLNRLLLVWRGHATDLGSVFHDGPRSTNFGELCLTLLGIWFFVCLVTSIALAGRKAIVVAFGLLLLWMAGCLVSDYITFISVPWFRWFYPAALLTLLLAAEVAAFGFASRRGLITWRALLLAAAIVAFAIFADNDLNFRAGWRATTADLGSLGICCLLPFPLVAAPLAVFYNRHR